MSVKETYKGSKYKRVQKMRSFVRTLHVVVNPHMKKKTFKEKSKIFMLGMKNNFLVPKTDIVQHCDI